MAVEEFTTYDVTDGAPDLTVTATTITVDTMRKDADVPVSVMSGEKVQQGG